MDVVTVCAGKDLENISLCVEGLLSNLDIDRIFVITNDISKVPNISRVKAIHENEVICSEEVLSLKLIDFPFSHERFGWYFQQFLKMEFSRSKFCRGDYLIWDADTILLKPIEFSDESGVIFTRGHERLNDSYVETYQNVFDIKKAFDFSVIAQHIFVDRLMMNRLIGSLECRTQEKTAYEYLLSNLSGDNGSLFSEYETYANYFANNSEEYSVLTRRWFRHAASLTGFNVTLEKLKKLFPECDYIALEKHDVTINGRIKGILKYFIHKFYHI